MQVPTCTLSWKFYSKSISCLIPSLNISSKSCIHRGPIKNSDQTVHMPTFTLSWKFYSNSFSSLILPESILCVCSVPHQNLGYSLFNCFNSFLSSVDFCCLLIIFERGLDPVHDQRSVYPDLDSNHFTVILLKEFFKKLNSKKNQQTPKIGKTELPSMQS